MEDIKLSVYGDTEEYLAIKSQVGVFCFDLQKNIVT